MKRTSTFIVIAITVTTIGFFSCSKKSTSKSTPPPACSTPSDCIVNTWYIQQWQANYNGSVVSIYQRGSNSNLANFDNIYWVFANNNKWTEYSSASVIFDAGTWNILPDGKTLEISASVQDTCLIDSVTANVLSINCPFDHNYPNAGWVAIAMESGLDTSKLNGYIGTFSTSQ